MSDYISKSALKAKLREWLPEPTTEQDADCKMLTEVMLDAWVDSLPTIDAVEVVRCRECKWGKEDTVFGGWWCHHVGQRGYERKGEWFCADGERSEE